MQYYGQELIEMTPEKWDGKSREMLVMTDPFGKFEDLSVRTIIGYDPYVRKWIDSENNKAWSFCAEIPLRVIIKPKYDFMENTMKTNEQTVDEIIDKIKKAILEFKNKIAKLEEENEELRDECIARKEIEEELKWERDQYKKELDRYKKESNLLGSEEDCDIEEECDEDNGVIDKLEEQIEKLRSECNSYRMKELLREEFENTDLVYHD